MTISMLNDVLTPYFWHNSTYSILTLKTFISYQKFWLKKFVSSKPIDFLEKIMFHLKLGFEKFMWQHLQSLTMCILIRKWLVPLEHLTLNTFFSCQRKLSKYYPYEHTEIQKYKTFIWNSVKRVSYHSSMSILKTLITTDIKKCIPYQHLEPQVFKLITVTGFQNISYKTVPNFKTICDLFETRCRNSYHTLCKFTKMKAYQFQYAYSLA